MTSDLRETVTIKQCAHCAAEMPASDNFCRWCGIRQETATVTAASRTHRSEFDTQVMRSDAVDYQTLSSLLVNTLAQSVAVKTMPLRGNRLGSGVVATLVAIPIWLLIILLSPLDAYAAASCCFTARARCACWQASAWEPSWRAFRGRSSKLN